jgi:hypothetical protein
MTQQSVPYPNHKNFRTQRNTSQPIPWDEKIGKFPRKKHKKTRTKNKKNNIKRYKI